MPQLITVPYNHVYLTILIIIAVGLLNYYKILIPLSLKAIKLNMKLKLRSIIINLSYINMFNTSSKIVDLYFNLINYYFYNIDLSIYKSIKFISMEAIQSIYIVNFLISRPLLNIK